MVKELTETEYMSLLPQYGAIHFMGGVSGVDTSATIYLVSNKMILVSNDETDLISELCEIQKQEAVDYMENIQYYE